MASYSNFLSLPREIKRMIYRELFTGVTVYPMNSPCITDKASPPRSSLTAIFETSHECYDDAKPTFLETVHFNFEVKDKYWLVRRHPDSPLPLPEHLSQTDLWHIRHLSTRATPYLDANLPAVFLNLKSVTVSTANELYDCHAALCGPKDQVVHVLRCGTIQVQLAEAVRSRLDSWVVPESEDCFPHWLTLDMATLMLHERKESYKVYKVIVKLPLELEFGEPSGPFGDCNDEFRTLVSI